MNRRNQCLLVAAGLASAVSFAAPVWADESDTVLEEVIVTAEKREENLQKTAIAVTALTADDLVQAGVSHPEDLNKLVPGLGIAQGGPSTQVYVRGVGNYGTNAFADPAVAFNMDGVYISRFSGISGNFFDISRLEVLKGPQGTLYGRNATGGTINIITNKPGAQFDAGATVEGGDYDYSKGQGFINLPLSDLFSVRFAAQKTSRDGYQTDGHDDDKSDAARLGMLFKASDNVSVLVTGNYLHVGGNGPAQVPYKNTGFYDNSNPFVGQSIAMPAELAASLGPPGFLFTGVDYSSGHQEIIVKGLSAQLDAALGWANLTVLANHTNNNNPSKFLGPGFLVDARERSAQNSVEARLAGDSGPVNWVAGVYHFDEDQSSVYWVDQGYLFNQTGVDMKALKDNTDAAFGQATFSATDRLRFTGGLRFTHEKKSQDGVIFGRQPATAPCASGTTQVFINTVSAAIPQAATNGAGQSYPFPYCEDTMTGSQSWNDTSWKGGVDFDLAEASMMYFTVSRGFKAGGYFSGGDHAVVPLPDGGSKVGNAYQPETLFAYALGSKNRFLGNRLQLNGEAFFWNYKDHQENYLAPTSSAGTFNFVTQQADAHIYGLDLEMDSLLSNVDKLSAKVQLLHARYTDATFITASPTTVSPRSACAESQSSTAPVIWYSDCGGQQMPRSPNLSFNVDYSHTVPLGHDLMLVPSVNMQYSASYWSAVDYNPLEKQVAYTTYGADLSLNGTSGKWSLTAYGANLGNKVYFTNAFMYPGTNSITNGGANNIATVALGAPRTFGLRLNMHL